MTNWQQIYQSIILALRSGHLPVLGVWSYIILAVLVALEGPVVTLLGASAASAGLMHPLPVFCAAVIGNLTADMLWYSLGYMGKEEWLFHFGKRFGIQPSVLEKMRGTITEHATKVLFLAKLTVSFVIPSLVTAGLLRLPLKRWLPPFILAETLWTASLVLVGFFTTEALKRVERGIEYVILAGTVLFILILILAGHRLKQEWDLENGETFASKN